uniref:Ig-like domain-containing protein n=1 Tax=Seriola lalandi dorsalis TaxID=1841481 RepID=A0A3B4WIP6_SERLL
DSIINGVIIGLVVAAVLVSAAAATVVLVSCVSMESCILPCSFQVDTDVIIHWIQVSAGNSPVHSFYYNKDQLAHQDQRFRNRTSLFKHQISGGNASLQLTGLQVQDQGRYKCFTSMDGKKHTPVGKVDLQQVGNRITCSSEGIYPQPELTWSTSPPSNVTFKNQPEVQETEGHIRVWKTFFRFPTHGFICGRVRTHLVSSLLGFATWTSSHCFPLRSQLLLERERVKIKNKMSETKPVVFLLFTFIWTLTPSTRGGE